MEGVDPFAACEGDWTPSRFGWLSPRISFSQDFAMLDRVSPEKRKREQVIDDGYASEFEFSLSKPSVDVEEEEGSMLSADELFFDGKLLPLHVPAPNRREGFRRWSLEDQREDRSWSMARHLSFESSRCESLSMENARERARRDCISLGNSRCSSPSRSFSLPPTLPASPKSSSRYSTRLKEFFKLKKTQIPMAKEVPAAELAKEQPTVPSSKRLPLSPKSFWPFSRSNSACESKTTTPPPLPRRSNSAGEGKSTSSSLIPTKSNATGEAKFSSSTIIPAMSFGPSTDQGKRSSSCSPCGSLTGADVKKNNLVPLPCRSSDAVALSPEPVSCHYITPPLPSSISSSLAPPCPPEITRLPNLPPRSGIPSDSADCVLPNAKQTDLSGNLSNAERDFKRICDGPNAAKARGCGSPGRAQRRALSSPARNFAKGSPGRRGGWNTPSKGSAGRIVLRNLERCSATPKSFGGSQDLRSREGWKGSERPNSYSASVRVTPVLNVPACIGPSLRGGKAAKPKLFNFRGLFSKKDKPFTTSPLPLTPAGNESNEG